MNNNPLGVLTGDKELKIGISIDLESILILSLAILLSVAIGSVLATIITKKLL